EPVTGLNDSVSDLAVWDPDGPGPGQEMLVIAGRLSRLGSVPVRNVCLYDGEHFIPMAAGVAGVAPSVEAMGTRLFAARNEGPIGRVAEWTGSEFVDFPGAFECEECPSYSAPISAIITVGGELCVFGGFSRIDGEPVSQFARWDGESWVQIPRWDGLPWNAPAQGMPLLVTKDHARTFIGACEWTGSEFLCNTCFYSGFTRKCAGPFNGGSVGVVSERIGGETQTILCGELDRRNNYFVSRAMATEREFVLVDNGEFLGNWGSATVAYDAAGRVTNSVLYDGGPADVVRFRGELVVAGGFSALQLGSTLVPAANIAVLRNGQWTPLQEHVPSQPAVLFRYGDTMLTGENRRFFQTLAMVNDFSRYENGRWIFATRALDWGYATMESSRQRIEVQSGLLVNRMFDFGTTLQHWDGARWTQVTGFGPSQGTQHVRLVPRADGSVWIVPLDPAGLQLIYSNGAYSYVRVESRPGRAWVEWNGVLYGEFDGCWAELGPDVWWHRLNRFLPGERIDTAQVIDGRLIVSGLLRYPGGGLTLGLAEWTGSRWQTVGGWITDAAPTAIKIERVLRYDGRFYAIARNSGPGSATPLLRLEREGTGPGIWRLLDELGPTISDAEVAPDGALWICGPFTQVAGIPCNKFVRLRHCYADIDCSGGVDSDDTIEFFFAWDTNDSRADVNGDGGVDADDTIMFFERWEAGC
ncbi:MAG: GC-type dockerin domain-anchored protein, partial [Phycisphaerales bacterium]